MPLGSPSASPSAAYRFTLMMTVATFDDVGPSLA